MNTPQNNGQTPRTGTLLWTVQERTLGAAADLDWATDELAVVRQAAAAGETVPDLVRIYVPEPTVAFGQRDARLPGFESATQAARAHGFEPVVRRAGGRAAAYHHGCVVVDHLSAEPDAALRQRQRFSDFADLFVDAFAAAGVPSRVGEIPGEYCPGEFSVRGDAPEHPVKLAGSAQRVVKGAWLFSTHVVVTDSAPLRAVLEDVYRELGLEMDARTVGGASDVFEGVDVPGFVDALREQYTHWADAQGLTVVDAPTPRT
ncbi:lipoyl protein ligase domain-containing protein [Micrococcus sp.]|uniref:lipoate--protein ligase family protein n=1 Tax=Micrococcus sp. TaxID=1271 RepID=UPI002A919C57|nr:lipoate--protein ligase family protein [Micrococcus sp.]MDY6054637.1 lipoate--protein ligase family protein [Micrococcus sp.]